MLQERRRLKQEDTLRRRGFFPVLEEGGELWIRGGERYSRSQALMVAFQEAANPTKTEPLPEPFKPFEPEWEPPPPIRRGWLAERLAETRKTRNADPWKYYDLPPCPEPQPEWEPVYLRFREISPAVHSFNWVAHTFEAGVSVFKGYVTPEGEYLIDPEWNASLVNEFLFFRRKNHPLFVIEGRLLEERGSGDEPLLADISSCEPVPKDASIRMTITIPDHFAARMELIYRTTKIHRGLGHFRANLSFAAQRVRTELGLGTRTVDPRKTKLPIHLTELVTSRATLASRNSSLHGPEHWKRVALAGCELLKGVPGADPVVVFLFALFHDSVRFNDSHDPEHGPRAAVLAHGLRKELLLSDEALDNLEAAYHHHADGYTTDDNPTIAVCWDADRLNLWRVGVQPDPALLSTEAARDPERIEWARKLQTESFSWEEICQHYVDTVEELRRA